jgi:hypothetical protein
LSRIVEGKFFVKQTEKVISGEEEVSSILSFVVDDITRDKKGRERRFLLQMMRSRREDLI